MREVAASPNLNTQVYEAILDAICDGALPAGEPLPGQEELAMRLKVSRQPVLQALTLLKSQGFVRERGRRGLMVAPLAPDFVAALYEVRGALDRLAAGLAATRVGAAARGQGERLIAAGRRATVRKSLAHLIAADLDFHRFVYELSGNPLVIETMGIYLHHNRRVMSGVLRMDGYPDTVWAEHAAILEAICAGDAIGAERLAGEHAMEASRRLCRAIGGTT
jgi:DNA-binding GntR family transcriptional regulator